MATENRKRRGQIIKRAGAYLVRVPLGRGSDGRRAYYNKTVHGTRKDAERHLTEKLRELDTGSFVGVVRQTLLDFGTEWLAEVATPRLSRKTQADYRSLFARHIAPALGHRRLSALHSAEIQKFYNELKATGLSARTVRYVHSVLHGILDHAVRVRLLHQNPTLHVSLPKVQAKEMRVLSRDEVKTFLRAARQDRYAALWELLLATGMRPGEAEALRWEDIRGDVAVVRRSLALYSDGTWEFKEPKTANGVRTVPLPPTTTRALERHRISQNRDRLKVGPEWRGELGLVFTNDKGGPVDHRKVMRRYFKKVLRSAGLPAIRPYDLRHTCASLLHEGGVPMKVISERLGHASVAFTMETYTHIMPGMQEAATEVMERIMAS